MNNWKLLSSTICSFFFIIYNCFVYRFPFDFNFCIFFLIYEHLFNYAMIFCINVLYGGEDSYFTIFGTHFFQYERIWDFYSIHCLSVGNLVWLLHKPLWQCDLKTVWYVKTRLILKVILFHKTFRHCYNKGSVYENLASSQTHTYESIKTHDLFWIST